VIVVWFNRKQQTRLMTAELNRIGNTPFCRLNNYKDLWLPGGWLFLEFLTIMSSKHYLLYLLLGGLWMIAQMPIVLCLAAWRKSWLNIPETIKNIPNECKHSTYLRKKAFLEMCYERLQLKSK